MSGAIDKKDQYGSMCFVFNVERGGRRANGNWPMEHEKDMASGLEPG